MLIDSTYERDVEALKKEHLLPHYCQYVFGQPYI